MGKWDPGRKDLEKAIALAPVVVAEIERHMPALAHLRRPGADLALLVDDGAAVPERRGVQGEDRPSVFHREHAAQMILHQPGPVPRAGTGSPPTVFSRGGLHLFARLRVQLRAGEDVFQVEGRIQGELRVPFGSMNRSREGSSVPGSRIVSPKRTAAISAIESADPICPTRARIDSSRTRVRTARG